MDASYATIKRGMSIDEVIRIMGTPDRVSGVRSIAWWDDSALGRDEDVRINKTLEYFIGPSFYIGITLEFTFDSLNTTVGRHRYD